MLQCAFQFPRKRREPQFLKLLCCTSVVFCGWSGHVCLVEMSEQEAQWGYSATALVVTSEIQHLYIFLN